jgi:hypothetical protein
VLSRDIQTGREWEIIRGVLDGVAVSPDGHLVALTERTANSAALRVVPVEGGPPRDLLSLNAPEGLGFVTWSADSAYLICARQYPQGRVLQREFTRIPAEGGVPRKVELGPAFSAMAGYSLRLHPDGHQLAFNTLAQPKSEVWVMENFLSALRTSR